jgi:poly(A) polymerase
MRATLQTAGELAAIDIVDQLRSAGHQAYLAGGCVRDLLLNRRPKDFDVATSARPEAVLAMFPRTYAVGAHFGVVLVMSDCCGEHCMTEVATFRSDGAYTDGRHPQAVRFSDSPEEDVQRRDFTINGMLLDPIVLRETGSLDRAVLDFVGGRSDLARRCLRAIGEPELRFEEDKLRMLRAVRFAARFNFVLERKTEDAIRASASKISQVSNERVRDELTRMLTEGRARRAFELLDQLGLLGEVLPEVDRMHGVEQPPEYHPEGDGWVHTLLLLEKLPERVQTTLAWAALLHDVGKPATFVRAPDRIRFNGHAEVGTAIAGEICRRLRFSNEEATQILSLVVNHMRFGDVDKMKESTLKRFFRLPKFEEHLALHEMDCLSSHRSLRLYDYARERYEAMAQEQVRPQLLVTGRDLIEAGYKPGPEFKRLLEAAEDAQLEGRITSREDGLALIGWIAKEQNPGASGNLGGQAPPRTADDFTSETVEI